jgi:hypothetical protein
MNATAPRPINPINAPYPGDLVGVGVKGTVVGTGVAAAVGTAIYQKQSGGYRICGSVNSILYCLSVE